jgi:hypothetical protein
MTRKASNCWSLWERITTLMSSRKSRIKFTLLKCGTTLLWSLRSTRKLLDLDLLEDLSGKGIRIRWIILLKYPVFSLS